MPAVRVCTHSAAVVNKPGQVSTFGGIYDGVMVNPEQIAAADALLLVLLLPQVGDDLERRSQRLKMFVMIIALMNVSRAAALLVSPIQSQPTLRSKDSSFQTWLAHLSDDLSHVLYHHLICCYGLHCKQTPVVDVTAAKADLLLAELQQGDVSI